LGDRGFAPNSAFPLWSRSHKGTPCERSCPPKSPQWQRMWRLGRPTPYSQAPGGGDLAQTRRADFIAKIRSQQGQITKGRPPKLDQSPLCCCSAAIAPSSNIQQHPAKGVPPSAGCCWTLLLGGGVHGMMVLWPNCNNKKVIDPMGGAPPDNWPILTTKMLTTRHCQRTSRRLGDLSLGRRAPRCPSSV
jgi:hypothetical protein